MDTKLVKDVWKWMNGAALAEKLAATLEQRVRYAEYTNCDANSFRICFCCCTESVEHPSNRLFSDYVLTPFLSTCIHTSVLHRAGPPASG